MRTISLRWNGLVAFGLLVVAYTPFLLATEWSWLASAGVWAEAGTTYWPAAHSASWLERLFATDSGYIPLPQRLVSLPAAAMPATWWPFWLSLVSTVGACALVAVFASRRFRRLEPSDLIRLLAALVPLLVLDFESANFINFVYLSVLPMAALAALAMADHEAKPPLWAWLLPLLCLSKPAVLTFVPALLLGAWLNPRYRRLAIACVVVAIVQVLRLLLSHGDGTMSQHLNFTLGERLVATARLVLGFTANFLLPPAALLPVVAKPIVGAVLVLLLARYVRGAAPAARALIVTGAIVLVGNFALLTFTLGDDWIAESHLDGFFLIRQNYPAFLGAELIVLGIAAATANERARLLRFGLWCFLAVAMTMTPGRRHTRASFYSQWQPMAGAIDAGARPLCVPLDPGGWMYGNDCRSLGLGYRKGLRLEFAGNAVNAITVSRPLLEGSRVLAFGIVAKPQKAHQPVTATAVARLRNGSAVPLSPVAPLPGDGGLILFQAAAPLAATDVTAVEVGFAAPVVPGRYSSFSPGEVVSGWFGN